ncbi:MAG: 4-hydroxy-tetrahydrodipicolinate reductase, partial [Candidatus Eisenbacteria bacterium]
AVAGATGRMGSLVARELEAAPEYAMVARLDKGTLADDWHGARAIADFTSPAGTLELAGLAAARGVGLLVGTTGLGAEAHAALGRAALVVPVMVAPNLSLGVAALVRALRAAVPALPGYDIEIVERHHAAKVDSPSGTALALARVVQDALGAAALLRAGRDGPVGPRAKGEIGMHSLRGGAWVGEHTVILAGPHETLELTHVAHDRAAFAAGALAALRFLAQARPGTYALEDALVS